MCLAEQDMTVESQGTDAKCWCSNHQRIVFQLVLLSDSFEPIPNEIYICLQYRDILGRKKTEVGDMVECLTTQKNYDIWINVLYYKMPRKVLEPFWAISESVFEPFEI